MKKNKKIIIIVGVIMGLLIISIVVFFIFKKNIWIEIKSFWNYKNATSLLEVLISNDV